MKKSVVARLFAMSLAAVMTMGLLTACGGSDAASTEPADTKEADTQVEAEAEESKTEESTEAAEAETMQNSRLLSMWMTMENLMDLILP